MKEKAAAGKKNWIFFALLGALFLALRLLLDPGKTECLTESYCISAKEHPWLLTGVYFGTLLVIILAMRLTLSFCGFLWRRGWFGPFAGGFMATLGALGIFLVLGLTPREELTSFIHVMVIGGICCLFGLWIFFRGFGNKRQ